MKYCSKCGTYKSLEEFHVKRERKDGRASTCKSCVNNRIRTYDSEKNRDVKLRKAYGLSIEDYEKILEAQGGKCAICGGDEPIRGRKLAVDHCHATGRVRGILCSSCNRALGLLKDSVINLEAAIKYLGGK